jgi:hypothetical protein
MHKKCDIHRGLGSQRVLDARERWPEKGRMAESIY